MSVVAGLLTTYLFIAPFYAVVCIIGLLILHDNVKDDEKYRHRASQLDDHRASRRRWAEALVATPIWPYVVGWCIVWAVRGFIGIIREALAQPTPQDKKEK